MRYGESVRSTRPEDSKRRMQLRLTTRPLTAAWRRRSLEKSPSSVPARRHGEAAKNSGAAGALRLAQEGTPSMPSDVE